MNKPRIVFLTLTPSTAPDVDDGGVAWRLLGSNNRELGRSAESEPTLAQAVAAVHRLRRHAAALEPMVTRVAWVSAWRWTMLLDGRPVARSARSFQRERESIYNMERFVAALPDVRIPEVHEVGTLPRANSAAFSLTSHRSHVRRRVAM